MVRTRIEGINTVGKRLADGSVRVYRYHRATGTPLPGKPGSPEFLIAYAEAEKSTRDRHVGTFSGLVRDFILSAEFDRLADSTKREKRRRLTRADAKFGDMTLAVLEDPRVRRDFLDWRWWLASSSGPREADSIASDISTVLTWALDNGRLSANHLSGFRRLYAVDRAHVIWLPEHIEAFMRATGAELQRALILALHTGQRQGDLLQLTWSN